MARLTLRDFPFSIVIFSTLSACVPLWSQPLPAGARERPLERAFTAGAAGRYRVELAVRSEVEGQRAIRGEGKAYAEKYHSAAGLRIHWRATRTVKAVDEAGNAEIEEVLEEIAITADAARPANDEEQQLRDALQEALERWKGDSSHTLRYRESPRGQISGLTASAGPQLDESPAVLTLWLARALRPTAALPARPLRFGQPWEEPRAARLDPWTGLTATEKGEWLEGAPQALGGAATAQLHVVQQIAGHAPPGAGGAQPGAARFHAESLSVVDTSGLSSASSGQGAVQSATRTAWREVSQTLERIPGLTEPPVFRGRLKIEIRIKLSE